MVQRTLKKCLFVLLLLFGVGQMARAALTFDDEGKAYIYPSDMVVTGMTLNPETGVLTKTEAGNAGITIDLSGEDFTNVTRIEVNVDVTSKGYTDLLWRTIVRSQTEDINAWYGSRYGIDYTAGDYQARSGQMKDILIESGGEEMGPKTGSMKINYICIIKNVVKATKMENSISLQELPYYVKNSAGEFVVGSNPNWIMDVETAEVYGDCNSVEQHKSYADVSDYDEIRVYQTAGTPARFWFFTATNSGSPVVKKAAAVEGEEYAVINIADVKAECGGKAYLIGVKSENSWVDGGTGKVTMHAIDVYKATLECDYTIFGQGDLNGQAQAALADANATVIDATGLTAPAELESANPNCLFIVNDASQLTNTKNVVVKGADGAYTCSNLVLTAGKPFRAPFDFTATSASMTKTFSNQFATLILPYDATVPEGCEAYVLTGVDENNVVIGESLEEATIPANTPVLLAIANAGEYDFNAKKVPVVANPTDLTEGLLTGVYSAIQAPTNRYVLQTQEVEQAFYHATAGNEPTMNPFTAYLTYTASNNANKLIFDLGGEVTSVENVEAATSVATVVEIYDLSGRQVSAPVKGINLMKMSDGTVKKVIVK